MKEIPPRAGWRTLAWSVIAPFALFFLLNGALLFWFQNSPYNRAVWLAREKWQRAIHPAAPARWLVLGDSSGSFGVSAAVLAERSGGVVYNLATTGDRTALDGAWLLDYYLQNNPVPEGVVLVHAPTVWYLQANRATLLAPVPLQWGFWNSLHPAPDLSFSERWTIFEWRYLPLIAQNRTLTEFARHPRSAFTLDFSMQADGSTGYFALKPDHLAKTASDQIYITATVPFGVSADNQLALEHYAALASQYGFELYVSNGALYDALPQNPTYAAFLQKAQEMLAGFAQTHPQVKYLADVQVFPSTEMESPYHPLPSAAKVFTDRLWEQILAQR